MSRYIASRAIRGAHLLVNEADDLLQRTIAEVGPDAPVAFPNTAYYLPTINGMMGVQVENVGQLQPVLEHARSLEFEKAARVRDQLALLREQAFGGAGHDNVLPLVSGKSGSAR